jgi:hypothetical protein
MPCRREPGCDGNGWCIRRRKRRRQALPRIRSAVFNVSLTPRNPHLERLSFSRQKYRDVFAADAPSELLPSPLKERRYERPRSGAHVTAMSPNWRSGAMRENPNIYWGKP